MPAEAVRARDWSSHPPYVYPDYKSTVLRGPKRPLVPLRHTLSELTGPVYGHESVGPLDSDLTKNGAKNGDPLGERIIVTGRVLDEAGRPGQEYADRDMAGERRRTLRASRRSARGAARCELLRRRTLRHRRARALPLHDGEAGRLSVAEPLQRLAAEPHPFLAVRPDDRHASRHADVFPRRSAARARPDLPRSAGRRTRAIGLAILHRRDRARLCARLRLRHRAARSGGDADGDAAGELEADAVADCRPLLRLSASRRRNTGIRTTQIASGEVADPMVPGERIEIVGQIIDGAGEADPRRDDRDLAGGFGRPLRASRRSARLQSALPRLRPLRDRHAGGEPLRFSHRQARLGRRQAGAAHQRHRSSCAAC